MRRRFVKLLNMNDNEVNLFKKDNEETADRRQRAYRMGGLEKINGKVHAHPFIDYRIEIED